MIVKKLTAQSKLNRFLVLSLKFGGKSQKLAEFQHQEQPLLGCMQTSSRVHQLILCYTAPSRAPKRFGTGVDPHPGPLFGSESRIKVFFRLQTLQRHRLNKISAVHHALLNLKFKSALPSLQAC